MAAEQGVGSCWCQIHLRSSLLGDDAEENVTSQIILPTRKQLWGGMILLAVLAFTILFLSVLMLWLMISYYENIFLILFIFLGSLSKVTSLPKESVIVTGYTTSPT